MPGIVIAGLLAAGKPEAAGIIGILAGIFLTMVTLGTLTAHRATPAMKEATEEVALPETTELAPEVITDIQSIPGLDLVESVPVAPRSEVTLQVSKIDVRCAHGFLSGNTWVIDKKGNLSRPICAAAKQFKALYQALPLPTVQPQGGVRAKDRGPTCTRRSRPESSSGLPSPSFPRTCTPCDLPTSSCMETLT